MQKTLFLIIVTQIIIESLPVSSSGHVMLFSILAKKFWQNQEIYFFDILDPLLHFSALIAISVTFFNDWYPPFKSLFGAILRFFSKQPLRYSQKKLFNIFFKIALYIFSADIVTSIFYLFFKVFYKDAWWLNNSWTLLFGFCCTTLFLFSLFLKQKLMLNNQRPKTCPLVVPSTGSGQSPLNLDPEPARGEPYERSNPSTSSGRAAGYIEQYGHKNCSDAFTLKKALILGGVQGLALIPGISRFASTYVAGYWLNLKPRRAFQISFLLHFPLIVAAFLFQGVLQIFKHPELLSVFDGIFLATTSVSTIIATLVLMITYKLALKNQLWNIGFYMLIPILLLIFNLK